MALFHWLCLAQEEAIPRLKCYSDSMLALVRDDGGELHHYAALIRSIRDLLAHDWEVDQIHTRREGNSSADFMAKLGVTLEDRFHRFEAPPAGMGALLLADVRRTPFLRDRVGFGVGWDCLRRFFGVFFPFLCWRFSFASATFSFHLPV